MKQQEFAKYVDMAMQDGDLANMRPVVEKELLHYEIFNALNEAGLLKTLVFQGGTSLRLCRGSERFSEDLDFAGGKDFAASSMKKIKDCIESTIGQRFGLKVTVDEPKPAKEGARVQVDKWTIKIETSPGRPDIAKQRIKIDIANIPAYTREPVPLRVNYSVLEGTSTVVVIAEKIDEILADKIVALPTSISKITKATLTPTPAKIRHRDIWDIAWLVQQGAKLDPKLVNNKVADYGILEFEKLLDFAVASIPDIAASPAFKAQMSRFIKKAAFDKTLGIPGYTATLASTVNQVLANMKPHLAPPQ